MDQLSKEQKATILAADDNPNDLELLKSVLGEEFNLVTASNGEEAYTLATELKPHCIISDVRMPLMSGHTFLKKIRVDEQLSDIPLILLSALDDSESKARGYDLLADIYLTKPVDTNELLAAAKSLIRLSKNRRVVAATSDTLDKTPGRGITEDDQVFLSRLLKVIHENIQNPDYTVEDLAKATFVSKRQLERRLKELENITPKNYIRQVRLEEAKKLLESGIPSNISDLAYRVGFKDSKYFSKIYHSFYGERPKIKS